MDIKEKQVRPGSGWFPLLVTVALAVMAPVLFVTAGSSDQPIFVLPGILSLLAAILMLCGFMAIAPNDSRVLLLFGDYKGTVVESGFYWVNPFMSKKKLSLRVRNFETGTQSTPETKVNGQVVQPATRSVSKPSKVNDRDGNPVDISAVVVWKVVDTAEALFAPISSRERSEWSTWHWRT